MTVLRVVRWLGVRTVLALVLLLVLIGSVVMGVVEASPGLKGASLWVTAGAAVTAGWLLAGSPLPGWLAGTVGLIVGFEGILLGVGGLGSNLLALVGTLIGLPGAVWRWPLDGAPDLTLLGRRAAEFGLAAIQVLNRLWVWLSALLNKDPIFDSLAVALVWNLVLWTMAFWAAWAIRRHRAPLRAMAPAGALLAALLSYNRGEISPLVFFLLAALPLLALVRYGVQRERWQEDHIDHPEDTGAELSLAVMGLTIVLVSFALGAPVFSARRIVTYARQLFQEPAEQTDRLAVSLGISQGEQEASTSAGWAVAALPRRHLIGTGPELEQNVVMLIETNPAPAELARRPYWRSLTFDSYTGDGWINGDTETATYKAGELAGGLPPYPHQIVHQKIRTSAETGGRLHSAGTLIAADHDYRVAWRTPSDLNVGGERDPVAATIRARAYQVESWLPNPTAAQLQAAGNEYPICIEDRYLALPSPLPSRVLTLTRQFETDTPNPFDRAIAIESFLRSFTYTLDLPPPPPDRDVVDYFLFDLQSGYCDYFASAMVVLARASGLPARLAIGYASGTFDEAQARTIITEADAHSWAEIYFPGYGWVEFEPTAGRPAIERPAEALMPEIPEEWQVIQRGRGFPGILTLIGRIWWIGLALPISAAVAWWAWDSWRLRRLGPARTSIALYGRLHRHGQRLGVPSQSGDTPHEFAAALVDRVATIATGRRGGDRLIPLFQEANWLITLYVRTVYSPRPPTRSTQIKSVQIWRQLRRRLWLAALWQWTGGRKQTT